jgi:hypothetical protein
MTLHAGQMVECIDDELVEQWLTKGQHYTIACVVDDISVRLVELGSRGPFWTPRFRPLVERKTDISAFTSLLNPANHKELT